MKNKTSTGCYPYKGHNKRIAKKLLDKSNRTSAFLRLLIRLNTMPGLTKSQCNRVKNELSVKRIKSVHRRKIHTALQLHKLAGYNGVLVCVPRSANVVTSVLVNADKLQEYLDTHEVMSYRTRTELVVIKEMPRFQLT